MYKPRERKRLAHYVTLQAAYEVIFILKFFWVFLSILEYKRMTIRCRSMGRRKVTNCHMHGERSLRQEKCRRS